MKIQDVKNPDGNGGALKISLIYTLIGGLWILIPGRLSHEHDAAMKRYQETGRRTISWKARELPGLHSPPKSPVVLTEGLYY